MSDQVNSNDTGGLEKSSDHGTPSTGKLAKTDDDVGDGGSSVCPSVTATTCAGGGPTKSNNGDEISPKPSSTPVIDQGSSTVNTGTIDTRQEASSAPIDDSAVLTNAGSSAIMTGDKVSIVLVFGKAKHEVTEFLDDSVANFKETVAKLTGVPPSMQKLMYKGMLKDGQTLRDAKLTEGCKVMLIGSTPTQVAAANMAPKPEELRQAEAQAVAKEPLCKQKQHAKVLEKGIPDDVMPGIKNARDSLPTAPISGMVNARGNKVRLTFKLEVDQVWLGTKERTDKIMMSQIKDVISEPIEGHEQYHIMGLQLGPTEASRYWLYWVPAQYVAAIKEAIIG